MELVFVDFSKAFDTATHKILIKKLLKYGMDEQPVRYFENWLKGQTQRVVGSGAKSCCRPVKAGYPGGQYWVQACLKMSLMI